jgi:hypothetical protein
VPSKGCKALRRESPSSNSLNCVASTAWIFLGSIVKMPSRPRLRIIKVVTKRFSCSAITSKRFSANSGTVFSLAAARDCFRVSIPIGSLQGYTGKLPQPSFLALRECCHELITMRITCSTTAAAAKPTMNVRAILVCDFLQGDIRGFARARGGLYGCMQHYKAEWGHIRNTVKIQSRSSMSGANEMHNGGHSR